MFCKPGIDEGVSLFLWGKDEFSLVVCVEKISGKIRFGLFCFDFFKLMRYQKSAELTFNRSKQLAKLNILVGLKE